MLIRDGVWESIRERFSEDDKVELRKHVTCETICPRGFMVDAESIPEPLQSTFMREFQSATAEARRNQTAVKGSTR